MERPFHLAPCLTVIGKRQAQGFEVHGFMAHLLRAQGSQPAKFGQLAFEVSRQGMRAGGFGET